MAWFSRSDSKEVASASTQAQRDPRELTLQDQAMNNAKALAKNEGRQANLTDYFTAAMQLQSEAEKQGIAWTPKEIGNFSGRRLDGITIRRMDFDPMSYLSEGADVSPAERAEALKTVNTMRAALSPQGVEGLTNTYDLDGNGSIEVAEVGPFYGEVQNGLNFENAKFMNVTFHPATTLHDLQDYRALGAEYGNVTLDGLADGEVLNLGSGRPKNADNKGESFSNVNVINAEGGVVVVNAHAIVHTLKMNGSEATLMVKTGGQVNDLRVEVDDSIHMHVERGGKVSSVRFSGTLDPDSKLEGSVWDGRGQERQFENATLDQVNFTGATMAGIHFNRTSMAGTSFAGATLRDTSFKDTDLSTVDFTGAQIHNVIVSLHGISTRVDSVEQMTRLVEMQSKAANIGTMLGKGSMSELAQNATVISPTVKQEPEVVAAEAQRFAVADTTLSAQQAQGAQKATSAEEVAAQNAQRAEKAIDGYIRSVARV